MTDENQPSAPTPVEETYDAEPKRSTRGRRILEVLFWLLSPIALVSAASLTAAILGAPWFRASLVFAIVAIGVGGFQLYRQQAWLPLGRVRSGSLIYAGLGALLLASAINAPSSTGVQSASRAGGVDAQTAAAPVPPRAPAPIRRSIYPWAYTVSPLTVTCENSTAPNEGQVIATAADGRVFALSETAQSGERPAIQTIEREDLARAQRRQATTDFAAAGLALCQGPNGPSPQLILSQGAPPPPPPSPWDYTSDSDEMSDSRISHACTSSTNTVSLGWPYETQRVTLCIRQHPRWGQDAIVRLERGGQFLCTSYGGCTVRVRFDDGEAAAYSASEPSDNSTDTLFISNDARFIGNLRRSSRVIIEANFYQAGAQLMSFETERLEWPPRS